MEMLKNTLISQSTDSRANRISLIPLVNLVWSRRTAEKKSAWLLGWDKLHLLSCNHLEEKFIQENQ